MQWWKWILQIQLFGVYFVEIGAKIDDLAPIPALST